MPTHGIRKVRITESRYGQPTNEASEVMWEEDYEPSDYTLDGAIRDAVMAAIELPGDEVVYEPNGDDIIDWREDDSLNISEQQIEMSSVRFAVNLTKDEETVYSLGAFAKQEEALGRWCWHCPQVGLTGFGDTMVQAVSGASDMIKSWWISSADRILAVNEDLEQDAANEE
jgi:hypothetical protein